VAPSISTLRPPPLFEYESVLRRATPLTDAEVGGLLDYLCSVAHRQNIFYLWRPCLRDPGDDLVLELAVASNSTSIVTFNHRDFAGAERFGVGIVGPAEFLHKLGD
jgi:predicted nucleic acid-binding protein